MKPNRRHFISTSLLGLAVTSACTKPQAPPASTAAPALDTSNEREIAYLIEREDKDHATPVPEDFQFKSGDGFRLRFRPGFAAYIYVANRGTGETSYRILFPLAAERGRNPIAAGTSVALPSDSEWMRFDQVSGNEYLVLIASSVALPALEKAGAQIPRDTFESQLAGIERQYRPDSSRRFHDGDWTKFFAARDGALALVVRLALQHG